MAATWLTPGDDLAPVARFLGITPERVSDSEIAASLELCVATAVEQLENRVGPIATTTVTERVESAGPALVLRFRPSSITSWVGMADVSGVLIDGQVVQVSSGRLPAGLVTYTTGWAPDAASVPAWARTAGLLLCRHLWTTQLGNQRANVSTADTPGAAWLWPRQVEALIAGRELAPTVFA